ncbi:hypothetical protein JCM8097_004013 [Rhodosporidiobolus ruineniae]
MPRLRGHSRLPSSDDDDESSGSSGDEESSEGSGRRRGSDGTAASTDDDSSGREGGSSDEDDEQDGRDRKKKKTTPLVFLILGTLILAALAAAAYFYFSSSSSSSSASSAASASAGNTGGDTVGGSTWSGGTGGTGENGGTGGTKASSSPSATAAAGGTTKPATKTANSASSGSSTTAAAASSSSSASSASNAGAKGVGFNNPDYTKDLNLAWCYSWNAVPGGTVADGVMFVPMLWGEKLLDGWEDDAKAAIKAGATHVLGFNEPDLAEQANLSPSAAASLWSSAIEPLATSAKLVSPAVSNGVENADGTPMGVPWMKQFLGNCSGCSISAVALHWYDSATNTAYFTKYLEDAHTELNMPIWLTEFMGTGSTAEQQTFVDFAVDYLEKQDWIERYAAFGAFSDNSIANFFDSDGSLTDLGKTYADAGG